jgi:hypothetical protein
LQIEIVSRFPRLETKIRFLETRKDKKEITVRQQGGTNNNNNYKYIIYLDVIQYHSKSYGVSDMYI